MLPAASRLRRSTDFAQVMGRGHRCVARKTSDRREQLLAIHWQRDTAAPRPVRVGLIISKSVGNAVIRHRLARRLRHIMIARVPSLPNNLDLVIRVFPPAANSSSPQLAAVIDEILSKIASQAAHQRTHGGTRVSS